MKIHYVNKIEGSQVVRFVARAWCALMDDEQWDKNSVLISAELQCVFAIEGRKIVGCLTFHVDNGEAIVNIAYVIPAFRGMGVYKLLHDKFIDVSKEQGAARAVNICYPSNVGIQEACKKLGYIPYVIHWTLNIPQESESEQIDIESEVVDAGTP